MANKIDTHRVFEDEYKTVSIIGYGAHSYVYKSIHLRTNCQVAVKAVERKRSNNIGQQEAEILGRVSHKNIVRTLDVIETPSHTYMVLEYMKGGDLFDYFAEHESISEQQAAQVLVQIIQGVAYLHSQGIVHRDIKPENILCSNRSWPLEVKVGDFGLAALTAPNGEVSDGTYVGTLDYTAPEMLQRQEYGGEVDMWSIGVVLYMMLSGRYPFGGYTMEDRVRLITTGAYEFPDSGWCDISDSAKGLVRGLLQISPEKRLTAVGALQHEFLANANSQSKEAIGNNLRKLRSSARKLRRARAAIQAINRIQAISRREQRK